MCILSLHLKKHHKWWYSFHLASVPQNIFKPFTNESMRIKIIKRKTFFWLGRLLLKKALTSNLSAVATGMSASLDRRFPDLFCLFIDDLSARYSSKTCLTTTCIFIHTCVIVHKNNNLNVDMICTYNHQQKHTFDWVTKLKMVEFNFWNWVIDKIAKRWYWKKTALADI